MDDSVAIRGALTFRAATILALIGMVARPVAAAPAAGSGWRCSAAGHVLAVVSVDHGVESGAGGVVAVLRYHGPVVRLPGTGGEPSVQARVTNLTRNHDGLFESAVRTSAGAEGEHVLRIGLVDPKASIPSGPLARVEFDCTAGAELGDVPFACTVDVVSTTGAPIPGARCGVSPIAD